MNRIIILILFFIATSCVSKSDTTPYIENGVSKALAEHRKERINDLKYSITFNIPQQKEKEVCGEVSINFTLDKKCDIIIDFLASSQNIISVKTNATSSNYTFKNEHIIIPQSEITIGENNITISFISSNQALNRRDEFLYTLLVPDRARTLFPCFDQPDLKALYTLTLEVPQTWQAIANGRAIDSTLTNNRKTLKFKETEPLSTYLFSFVAGEFNKITKTKENHTISLYHREIDPKKIAQCDEILNQVFTSLTWLEEYTSTPYPFDKYDLIILPGFQYGGMEHTGATLYADKTMFLSENPTLEQQLNRSKLIAHETAHMWFGDYVTMKWFSDVWTKEVFANYFASQIVAPMYPEIDHNLNFMTTYAPSAYSEDRTSGANSIQQELGNLQDAGLVYGRIIYTKSPIVMDMMVKTIGETSFQEGIKTYLSKYKYSNATWTNLIDILDQLTPIDLTTWSNNWVNEKGVVKISYSLKGKELTVKQEDPLKRGIKWSQPLEFTLIKGDVHEKTKISLIGDSVILKLKDSFDYALPNSDGKGYGLFSMNKNTIEYIFKNLHSFNSPLMRGSLLISLYENLLAGDIDPDFYIDNISSYLTKENNQLLYLMALNNVTSCYLTLDNNRQKELEDNIWTMFNDTCHTQNSSSLLKAYSQIVQTDVGVAKLYNLWQSDNNLKRYKIGENDAMTLSYELAVRMPNDAQTIIKKQRYRLTGDDRKREYDFITRAVSPIQAVRDSMFLSLLIAENRRIEPWAETALSYLNHRNFEGSSDKYIYPSLCIMQEIQRTGDIFFAKAWAGALLKGHRCKFAKKTLNRFFEENPDYPPMLAGKIKQQADHILKNKNL